MNYRGPMKETVDPGQMAHVASLTDLPEDELTGFVIVAFTGDEADMTRLKVVGNNPDPIALMYLLNAGKKMIRERLGGLS